MLSRQRTCRLLDGLPGNESVLNEQECLAIVGDLLRSYVARTALRMRRDLFDDGLWCDLRDTTHV